VRIHGFSRKARCIVMNSVDQIVFERSELIIDGSPLSFKLSKQSKSIYLVKDGNQ